MTISSTTRKAGPFAGNDVTVNLPFTFKVFAASDVLVVTTTALGVDFVEVLGAAYTVNLNEDQNTNPGGVVVLAAAAPAGTFTTLASRVPLLQPVDLTNGGGFYPSVLTAVFDRLVIQIQQLAEEAGRALSLSISSSSNVSAALPPPSASSFLGWNAEANAIINYAGVSSVPVSNFMSYVVGAETEADARARMGVPVNNLLVNPAFKINQRGYSNSTFAVGLFVRDMWKSRGVVVTVSNMTYRTDFVTVTPSGVGNTGKLLSVASDGKLIQERLLTAGVTYTFSNTGTAKLSVYRLGTPEPSFTSNAPITFTADSSTELYEFALSDGTLGTVLLSVGTVPGFAEERSDQEELLICQKTCFAYNGGLGSARSSDNLYESMLHLPVAFGSNIAIESATFTPSTGSAGTPQIYVGVGSPASKQSVFIRNSANNWTVGAEIALNAVFVPS